MKIVFVVGWAMFLMVLHFGNFVFYYFVRVTEINNIKQNII